MNTEIRIEGDPQLHASFGELELSLERGQAWLSIPDRFGHSTVYNFAPADWARIVELINHSAIPATESN